jgi:Tfp pilus assembly protein PilX
MEVAMRGTPPVVLPRAQRGVILFISLIVLVAMSLAGVALMRSVDTNILIAGNLAFRQGATLAADRAIENARTWLLNPANANALALDQPVSWYWANWQAGVNVLTGYNWADGGPSNQLGADAGGNDVRYVVHRMCEFAGDQNAPNANCVRVPSAGGSAAGTKGAVGYGIQALPGTQSTYYRVTVRVAGPRNTVSYVQAMLN